MKFYHQKLKKKKQKKFGTISFNEVNFLSFFKKNWYHIPFSFLWFFFKKKLQLDSIFEVNLDETIIQEIEERIKNDDITEDIFLKATKSIFHMLRYSLYPVWRNSNLFRDALKKSGLQDIEELRPKKNVKQPYHTLTITSGTVENL